MANPLTSPIYLCTPLVAAIISFCLVVLIIRKDPKNPANGLFALTLLTIGSWGAFIFSMRTSPSVEHALAWQRILYPLGVSAFLFYYHFSCIYTRVSHKKLLIAAYLFLILTGVLSMKGLVVSHVTLESYGYCPHYIQPNMLLVSAGGFFFMTAALVNLVKSFRTTTRYEDKTRLAYMITAIAILVLFGVLDVFPALPPMNIIGNILFSIITAVAILKYHLLDIHLVVRRGVSYFLMSTIVAVPYVGIIILFNNMVGSNNVSTWGYPVLLVVLALLLQPLWHIVQRTVDRWFYRERYDFLKELEYFSQEAHDISDLEQLGSSLVRLVRRALQISNVHLLLRSETGDFSVVFSTGDRTAELTLRRDSPLVRWLQSNKGLLNRQDLEVFPQLQSLSAKERNDLGVIEAELFVPLRTSKDELVGLMILGRKLSHQLYSDEDMGLISTVASRVAIELENARLYTLETTMRQELERQDTQKTEFLHSVAHELKTPLTAIISSSELMSTEDLSATPDMRERLVDNINRSAWLMDRRVGELLDLARMRIGNIQLKLEVLEIAGLIDEVASQLSSLFKNKGQSLGVEVQDELPLVKADRERVQQVLLNLLSNANKYSPTGTNVLLRVLQKNNSIQVDVEDSATAIRGQDKDKLFDPYFRGGNDDERQRIPGLGLGLAISKKIVELHQGEIWVESEAGKGNIFSFSLPIWNEEQVKPDDSHTLSRIGG